MLLSTTHDPESLPEVAAVTPLPLSVDEVHTRRLPPGTRYGRAEELTQRRVDALVAFVSFSLMLTILGLVFFALETWHA